MLPNGVVVSKSLLRLIGTSHSAVPVWMSAANWARGRALRRAGVGRMDGLREHIYAGRRRRAATGTQDRGRAAFGSATSEGTRGGRGGRTQCS